MTRRRLLLALEVAASLVTPGEAVPVVVRRAGKELRLTVKPAPGL